MLSVNSYHCIIEICTGYLKTNSKIAIVYTVDLENIKGLKSNMAIHSRRVASITPS